MLHSNIHLKVGSVNPSTDNLRSLKKNPKLFCFQNRSIPLFESEANLCLLVCIIKGAAGKYPFY